MVERLDPDDAMDNTVASVQLFAKRGMLGADKVWYRKEAFVCLYNVSFHSPDVMVDDLLWFTTFPVMAEEIKERVACTTR